MLKTTSRKVVVLWENFGPGHVDRCAALARSESVDAKVIGIELVGSSSTYQWERTEETPFDRHTLFPNSTIDNVSGFSIFMKVLLIALKHREAHFFFCHYERIEIFALAIFLRIMGAKVFVMNDSKFDDYARTLPREIIKYIFYSPYQGGLSSGIRSADYLRFLGVPADRISTTYNTLSLERLRKNGISSSEEIVDFESRHFTVIARLVPKKNLFVVLESYAIYCKNNINPRKLVIAGNGPLEAELKQKSADLGIAASVEWLGFVQTDAVSKILSRTLALLLLSTEEQFGNVIIEAQAFALPCIVSTNVGARDDLIRTGVNGFVVEPENPAGAAFFMSLLANDSDLWKRMSAESASIAVKGDVQSFCCGVTKLLENI